MAREFPAVAFERYVDDVVVHCVSEARAREVLAAVAERMEQVGLRLHPDKTRIVYCQDGRRRASYEHTEFTFLGFTFRQRRARSKDGKQFSSFNPAISRPALNKISTEVRSWRLHNRTGRDLVDVARDINPIVRGWMNYYGSFNRSAIYPLLQRINAYLIRCSAASTSGCVRRRRPSGVGGGSFNGPRGCSRTGSGLLLRQLSGDQDDKSPVTGDGYAGICGGLGLKCPGLPDRNPENQRLRSRCATTRKTRDQAVPGQVRRPSIGHAFTRSTHESLDRAHAACMPDTAWAVSGYLPDSSRGKDPTSV